SFHQGLMRCYERLDKRTEAFSAYRRLKHTLSVVLGVPPSDATQKLFQDMLSRQAADCAPPQSNGNFVVTEGAGHSRLGGIPDVVVKLPARRSRKR
ncbi:MAG: bacterial transcriptional activator domain-containing protein, partial [Betaproteobacteria bacterium]